MVLQIVYNVYVLSLNICTIARLCKNNNSTFRKIDHRSTDTIYILSIFQDIVSAVVITTLKVHAISFIVSGLLLKK